ncbi:MAG: SMP-30/gluconolactonase/LRE family protein [Pirellulaceae bacterium]
MMRYLSLLAIALLIPDHCLAEEAPARSLKKDQSLPSIAVPCTADKLFTTGIEGPACDRRGFVYAVNFQKQGTIGRVRPNGKARVFVDLPAGSVGNGIRFGRDGMMYVADYPKHNVLQIDPRKRTIRVFAHNENMNQPNDLAIDGNGVLYASDPNWGNGTGQLWRIDRDGNTTRLAEGLGTTNGVEVSPDNKTLYVNESVQKNVWAFPILEDGTLGMKRLVRQFPDHGFDGIAHTS